MPNLWIFPQANYPLVRERSVIICAAHFGLGFFALWHLAEICVCSHSVSFGRSRNGHSPTAHRYRKTVRLSQTGQQFDTNQLSV